MANNKQIIRDIELRLFDVKSFEPVLSYIFNTEEWKEIEGKRNKLCKAMFKAGADRNALSIGIDKHNKKLAGILFDNILMEGVKLDNVRSGRCVSVGEYIEELPKTEENINNCIEFYDKINMAAMMADILESFVIDANSALKRIDKNHCVTDFDAINAVRKPLMEMSSMIHKGTNEELCEMWTDFVDDIQENVSMKYKLFIDKYTDLADKLYKEGKITNNLKHKLSKK